MRKLVVALGILALVALVLQAHPGFGRWIPANSKVVTLEGTLVKYDPGNVVFKADGKQYWLHLGPYWYLEDRGIMLQEGAKIKVKGYLISQDSELHLVAAELSAGGKIVQLRDANGWPLWHRYGRKGQARGHCFYGRGYMKRNLR